MADGTAPQPDEPGRVADVSAEQVAFEAEGVARRFLVACVLGGHHEAGSVVYELLRTIPWVSERGPHRSSVV
jgi:hypothetical protein